MNLWLLFVSVIAVIILVLGVFAVIQFKKQKEIQKANPGYPKGYWMNQGIGIGVAIGVGIGIALGNIAIGIGIGVAIGAAIGAQLEKKHKGETRPLTEEERQLKKQSIIFTAVTMLIAMVIFVIAYFVTK